MVPHKAHKKPRRQLTHAKRRHPRHTVHVGKGLKRAIKKIAQGPIETKYVAEDDFSDLTFNSVITGSGGSETYRAIPLLHQGTTSFNESVRELIR